MYTYMCSSFRVFALLYIYIYMKAEKETRCGSVRERIKIVQLRVLSVFLSVKNDMRSTETFREKNSGEPSGFIFFKYLIYLYPRRHPRTREKV